MSCGSDNLLPTSSLRYSLKLAQFALEKLTYVLSQSLTITTFHLIEMSIGMWSELRAGFVVQSARISNDGVAIVMSAAADNGCDSDREIFVQYPIVRFIDLVCQICSMLILF